ncbi:MAG TPA: di-heme oxidoredictase family protein [Myxococcaceae bacterium]|nr:di-heme oxidoredictase family protein [Myxococcaceae bacterium]
MRRVLSGVVACIACTATAPYTPATSTIPVATTERSGDAMAAFDGLPNGMVDIATHRADQAAFDKQEEIASGLGPLYNAHSCRDCHENPVAGGGSQVTELRAGHLDAQGKFIFPEVRIGGGSVVVKNRTLINDKAICPGAESPEGDAQEHLPEVDNIRAMRLSVSMLGDGYVEAVPDALLEAIARWQCGQPDLGVCGTAMQVPVLESPDAVHIGRFGWKSEHASVLSFSADAYLNEMGVTSALRPTDVTPYCDTVPDPEDQPDATGIADLDRFARFIRATKAPPRDARLAATAEAKTGSTLFETIGCAVCHAPTLTTAPAGTPMFGGPYRVPDALGSLTLHPYSDYLVHDVGTGDGIMLSVPEHHGPQFARLQELFAASANKIRTAPLWGLRTRSRLMHDGLSYTLREAISRHQNEGRGARTAFEALPPESQEHLLAFLRSL